MQKHDKVSKFGFDVPIQQLAHELALAELSNNKSLSFSGITDDLDDGSWRIIDEKYYETYQRSYARFKRLLDDKTRYDSTFSE